ncbi:sensor histidine kinase [Microcella sp.]|uniref:sensor histidine kinase n=1 Tax=Microcella sp. TaxID=1913979 RepID=UPI00299F5649|nr:sensor histidine kinase [Microcella sp.]MDX2025370.1 sensor histidine kinase [Microcella sp.]
MTSMRWWDAAVLGTAALLAVLLLVLTDVPWRIGVGVSGIALLVVAWIALGRRGTEAATVTPLIVAVVVASGLVVSAYPTLAIIQVIAYPIAWSFSATMRRAVVANIAIALAVGVGFLVSLGTGTANLVQTAFTVALSLIFSLAMGFWISRMTALGEERGRLLVELQGAQEQIAALNRAAGAADERERMARDLHDTIAQDLTGLVMLAQRARREATAPDATLALLEENARAALTETRALVAAGAAVADDGLDLASALHRLADRFMRETGVRVELSVDDSLALSRDVDVVALRCVQEALGNARKHARASRVTIDVSRVNDDRLRVRVIDDGIGFDPAAAPDGFGLTGMTERLSLVHGTLSVTSAPGAGTTLTAELPTDPGGVRA